MEQQLSDSGIFYYSAFYDYESLSENEWPSSLKNRHEQDKIREIFVTIHMEDFVI